MLFFDSFPSVAAENALLIRRKNSFTMNVTHSKDHIHDLCENFSFFVKSNNKRTNKIRMKDIHFCVICTAQTTIKLCFHTHTQCNCCSLVCTLWIKFSLFSFAHNFRIFSFQDSLCKHFNIRVLFIVCIYILLVVWVHKMCCYRSMRLIQRHSWWDDCCWLIVRYTESLKTLCSTCISNSRMVGDSITLSLSLSLSYMHTSTLSHKIIFSCMQDFHVQLF